MTATKISSAQARIADGNALTRLLDEVPEAQEIRDALSKPYFTRRWQQSMQRSFWITSDGTTAVCHTVTGLDLDEMVVLWVSFDEHRHRAGFTLSALTLSKIIETELGLTVELEN
ncbi:MAG TPA: hypothetical protein VLX90_04490 [Steroidobacteraceae bacterium]|nr:hypothetical protein [Steroidobacteraceae bacterium]